MTESKMPKFDRRDLHQEDRERMQRLSEEVRGRLQEMALILARTNGIELPSDAVLQFVPTPSLLMEDGGCPVKILEFPDQSPNCLCLVDPPGVSQPCQIGPIMSTV